MLMVPMLVVVAVLVMPMVTMLVVVAMLVMSMVTMLVVAQTAEALSIFRSAAHTRKARRAIVLQLHAIAGVHERCQLLRLEVQVGSSCAA